MAATREGPNESSLKARHSSFRSANT